MRDASMRGEMSGNVFRNYDFGYAADKLPAMYGKPLNVSVELDTTSGRERIADRKAASDLDSVLEMAAAASVKK